MTPKLLERQESLEQYARRRIAEMWSTWHDDERQTYAELSIDETMALIEAEYYGRLN